MNEFIVWDDEDKEFIELDSFIENNNYEDASENEKVAEFLNFYYGCETYDYIGLKDINNNKIYADSSIVEFDWQPENPDFHQKKKGIFVFCTLYLKYVLHIFEEGNELGKVVWDYNRFSQVNFKIIDTIQENKLGLIK